LPVLLSRDRKGAVVAAVLLLSSCAKHYRVEGLVLSVDRAASTLVVSHGPIGDYMPAMAMPFHAADGRELNGLSPGARVRFDLKVGRQTAARRIQTQSAPGIEGVRIPVPPQKLAVGDPVPDFALTDQNNRPVRPSNFRGRVVVIDFIYTRCPLPDVCPRLSANFALLQRRFHGRLGSDLALLSITIDPHYDTPAVLAAYAQRWHADGEAWRFLTGPPDQMQQIAGYFGLVYWAEEGLITHTSATAILDREGRLAALVEGSSFRATQLADLVERFLARSGMVKSHEEAHQ
jgi:protein SCO1/2